METAKIQIECSNCDTKHSIAPAKTNQNLTFASGNWDITLQPEILYLVIYDLLVISIKYLTIVIAKLKWKTQNANYVPINPLTTHDFDLDFQWPKLQAEIRPANRHVFL